MKRLILLVCTTVLLAGCSTGQDAVTDGSNTYSFTSPGGKTRIFYPEAERKAAPEIHGESVRDPGKQIRLADFRGKAVVINVWGSWCGPCRSEAPDLQKATAKFGNRVQLLGVNFRDGRQQANDFLSTRGLNYPSIFDPAGRSLLSIGSYPLSTVPTTMVLDPQHRVAAMYLVPLTQSDLETELHKLVG
ncbi:TlpA family protein disulfide reductase [Sciscionella marina]|uniref:TlpA family protein disulfide reductase n=1 Tax=Sciscionella marina TaxID=508770 RepID=UPI000365F3A2|nr:TlpA disulfide reductase family protein [Sciscionella marina]